MTTPVIFEAIEVHFYDKNGDPMDTAVIPVPEGASFISITQSVNQAKVDS